MKIKTIGILGGMGPNASAVMYQKVISYCQEKYLAVQDTDYPPIIIQSITLDGFDESGIVDAELVKSQLLTGLKKLEKSGANIIAMACNSVHFFYADLQKNIKKPLINLLEIVAEKAVAGNYKTVGILSSESTSKLKMYEKVLIKKNIKTISASSDEQKILNNIIESVMAGKQGEKETKQLEKIIKRQIRAGAQAIVLGCTELPLAIKKDDVKIPLIDSLQILTEYTVDHAYGKKIFITDEELAKIFVSDCKEPMVNIKEYIQDIELSLPKYITDKNIKDKLPYLRESVAKKLSDAQKLLPKEYKLVLRTGYRPLSIQKKLFEENLLKIITEHPQWTKKRCYEETSKKIAPLDVIIPPHSTGGAIDITLADNKNHMLDMGTEIGDFSVNSYTNSESIPNEANKNRKLLISIMEKVGFVNYPTEWWHWSYGDQYWAAKTGNKNAIYNSVNF